jgi:hypothetical protein
VRRRLKFSPISGLFAMIENNLLINLFRTHMWRF